MNDVEHKRHPFAKLMDSILLSLYKVPLLSIVICACVYAPVNVDLSYRRR